MSAEENLKKLGLVLPPLPQPAGAYTRAVRLDACGLIFISGQLPLEAGQIKFAGKLGANLAQDAGYQAAQLCALNALSVLQAELGSLEAVSRIVRLGGFVASTPDFTAQAQVINGASDLMAEVFGAAGVHARYAVGVAALPLDAAVELEVIAEINGSI
jgi:enamine deaminase RidA (YjgF/YER057c/UK114 family)